MISNKKKLQSCKSYGALYNFDACFVSIRDSLMGTKVYIEYLYIWTISNKIFVNNKILYLFELYSLV